MVLKKIGLTGATGMLGRHLRAALEAIGVEVIAVSRVGAAGGKVCSWDLADWRSSAELDSLFPDIQAVVHAGAIVQTSGTVDEERMFNANVRACVNLGGWAISRNVPVVHISSSTVYANTTSDLLNEEAMTGWSGVGGFYAFSKLLAQDVFERLKQQGLKLAVVRPSSLYGFGLPDEKMVSKFLRIAKEGGTIELTPPVHDKIDFIHTADVALAIVAILKNDAWETFNIASGAPVSIEQLARACISIAGRGQIKINEGNFVTQPRGPIVRFALDINRAKNVLNWKPEVSMEEGLMRMHQKCLDAKTEHRS
jgi:nucleoside-diphosphate-sugar epimerase